jgi:hypothetical protein
MCSLSHKITKRKNEVRHKKTSRVHGIQIRIHLVSIMQVTDNFYDIPAHLPQGAQHIPLLKPHLSAPARYSNYHYLTEQPRIRLIHQSDK